MGTIRRANTVRRANTFATDYNDHSAAAEVETSDELVIPEDLTALSDSDLAALADKATETFDALFEAGGEEGWSNDDLETLSKLTDGLEDIKTEQSTRTAQAEERASKAAELAARVRPELSSDANQGEKDEDEEDLEDDDSKDEEKDDEKDDETKDQGAAETVTASGKRGTSRIKVDRSRVSRTNARFGRQDKQDRVEDILFATGDGTGFANGEGINVLQAAQIIDKQLSGYKHSMFASAAANGRQLRQQQSVVTIRKPFSDDLIIKSNDNEETATRILEHAASESRLRGGSLIAAGGWCAPSETIYDLLELESRDGIFSLPTTNWVRGGISRTLGPSFSDLYTEIVGFHYTETQDIAGDYDGAGGGSKPCYKIDCPEFEEFRLDVDGLCIQAGLLQRRGYPEMIARVLRGALIAHDHRMAARRVQSIATGSTAVTMPTPQQGATAALLATIELQAESIRYAERLSRSATLEGVFPFWVRGVVRVDLSRRLGVDLMSVPDSRITAWFTERQIAPQFIYNYQDLGKSVTAWPATLQFLMYPAGTWVEGTNDVITVENIFDSTLLGTNDYTALFTEEASKVVKMGHDSRVITVPVCADGATAAGIDFECNGTTAPAAG